jgi:hypothetical protein
MFPIVSLEMNAAAAEAILYCATAVGMFISFLLAGR